MSFIGMMQHIYYPELADKYEAAFGAKAVTSQLTNHDMDEDAVERIFAPLLEAKLEKEVRRTSRGSHNNLSTIAPE
jgi:hypothetical protein